jgi:hypothetical protein
MRRGLLLASLAVIPVVIAVLPVVLAAPTPPAAPTVATGAATSVTSGGATLSGRVNPNGQATMYAFQWGPTNQYGQERPQPRASAGSGTTAIAVTAALSGLSSGTTYHVRIIAISAVGVSTGADQMFKTTGTPPPS